MTSRFPDGFLWGVAASAYQIEGAAREDGRGPSIWDTFAATPGRIEGGDTGEVACDHYHRFREDVDLMAGLGVGAYRFSVAWPRVLPAGAGRPNPAGLDFYDRLTDTVLATGVEPWLCLHHWDLPQALEDRGGWRNRDIVGRFADYVAIVLRRLGDRTRWVVPVNEPNVLAWLGHATGLHAPGLRSHDAALAAIHHLNLAHGAAADVARDLRPGVEIGTIVSMAPAAPARDDAAHRDAADAIDALWNRALVDPVLLGRYPDALAGSIEPFVRDGDAAAMHRPADFFGLNHYSRLYAAPDRDNPFGVGLAATPRGLPVTGMGWQIDGSALAEQVADIAARYEPKAIYVTENGAAFDDRIGPDGRVADPDRVAYLAEYLDALAGAVEAGAPVRGYFAWSLLDNFEWDRGYAKRFGLVYVDYPTQARVPKASYDAFRDIIAANAVPG